MGISKRKSYLEVLREIADLERHEVAAVRAEEVGMVEVVPDCPLTKIG